MIAFKKFFRWPRLTPNWYVLYFALATLDVVTVLCSFGLNIKLTNDYAESVALNRAWATRLSSYAELSLAAQAVNAPGNDVFDSHDPKTERGKMHAALNRFQTDLRAAHREIKTLQDPAALNLLKDFAAIESAMNDMVSEASLIFGFFEQKRATEAGQRMATMDRRYARVNATLGNLSKNVSTIQQTIFEAQLQTAQTLRRIEYAMLVLVGLMVFGALRYGRQIAQSMKQAEAERQRMENMKAEFVSVVSHELRTPLTSLLGTLRLIRQGVIPAAQMPGMIELAHRNGERLAGLVNDLLDLEKSTTGKLHMTLQPQPLLPVIEQALEACATYTSQTTGQISQCQVLLSCDPPDWQPWANIDAQRLQQVLLNLLSNAIKYSPPEIPVRLSYNKRGDSVRISVQDQGPGVPEAFRQRIFQKFAQADSSATRAKGGTGLGLAIAKELMEAMHGSVGFDSTPGQGSTFFIDLPLCPAQASANAGNSGSNASNANTNVNANINLAQRNPLEKPVP